MGFLCLCGAPAARAVSVFKAAQGIALGTHVGQHHDDQPGKYGESQAVGGCYETNMVGGEIHDAQASRRASWRLRTRRRRISLRMAMRWRVMKSAV